MGCLAMIVAFFDRIVSALSLSYNRLATWTGCLDGLACRTHVQSRTSTLMLQRRGFTLIELLVVIAIIAVLIAPLAPCRAGRA